MNSAEAVDCQTAWNRLQAYNGKPVWQEATKVFCKNFGFDMTGASYVACRNIFLNTVNDLVLGGVASFTSPEDFARQIRYGAEWRRFVMSLDSSTALAGLLSSIRSQSTLIGTGIAAEAWIPHIKVVVEAILIAMTPLILLFLASSFSLDALKTLIGLWLFYAFWVVTDKIMEGFWVSYAQSTWDQIQAAGIGMASQEQLWLMASKTLAVLGAMRTKGMLLAGVFTYGIFRFGGSALAHLAGGLTASSVGTGGSAAGGAVTPERTAQKVMATSWMSDAAIAAQVGRERLEWLYKYGEARVGQERRLTRQIEGMGGIEGASRVGYYEGKAAAARARATAQFTDRELYYSALASHLRGMGLGRVADGLMRQGLDGVQSGLILFSGGRVSLGGVEGNVLSGFAREMGLDEGLLRKLAGHTYISPRFDSKGNIKGFNVEMRLAPQEAELFAGAIKEKNPNVAARLRKLAAEGRSVAVSFAADDGRIIAGEGKSGFKVRELDLAQSEKGTEDRLPDRESRDLNGEQTYILRRDGKPVMTFISGHLRREGDSLVLTNARSDTGAFFHELKLTRDGKVQGFRLRADNKEQLKETVKNLGLFNYLSGKHYRALPENTPVVAIWDGAGKINAGTETQVKDLVTKTSGTEIRVPFKNTGEGRYMVFSAPEFAEKLGLPANTDFAISGGYSYDSNTQTLSLAPGARIKYWDPGEREWKTFYIAPAEGTRLVGIDPAEYEKMASRTFTIDQLREGMHIDALAEGGRLSVVAEDMRLRIGGENGVEVSKAGISNVGNAANIILNDVARLERGYGISPANRPFYAMLSRNPALAETVAKQVAQQLPVSKLEGQEAEIYSSLMGKIGKKYAGVGMRGVIRGSDKLSVDTVHGLFASILGDEKVPLEERLKDFATVYRTLDEAGRKAGVSQRDSLTHADVPEALREFGKIVKENKEAIAVGAAAAIAVDQLLDRMILPKTGAPRTPGPVEEPGVRAPDLERLGMSRPQAREAVKRVLSGAGTLLRSPGAMRLTGALAISAGLAVGSYELAKKLSENEEDIGRAAEKLGSALEPAARYMGEHLAPLAERMGKTTEELTGEISRMAVVAAKGAKSYSEFADNLANQFAEKLLPVLNREEQGR